MDEILVLLKSLLNGTYAGVFNCLKDMSKGIEIGKNWETAAFKFVMSMYVCMYEEVSS